MDNPFPQMDALARKAWERVAVLAEPRLVEGLKSLGVTDQSELPLAVLEELFRKTLLDVAALHFPGADLNALDRSSRSMAHPLFFPARKRAKRQAERQQDFFQPAAGADCAIVMAGYGVPVAPFQIPTAPTDKPEPQLLAEPSANIDVVASNFAQWPGATVGYSTCAAPFYVLLTDCLNTLRELVRSDDRLRAAQHLIERAGFKWPKEAWPPFNHGMMVIVRESGDKIPTLLLAGAPDRGSVFLQAGWLEDELACGAPNGGYLPVPLKLVERIITDPALGPRLAGGMKSEPASIQ